MYANCAEFSDYSACTYYHVNNPYLGSVHNSTGAAAPDGVNTCSTMGKPNISIYPNCFGNRKSAAAASQHNINISLTGKVQPHHQCFHSGNNRGSKIGTDEGIITWCTIMFTNRYCRNTVTGDISQVIFISDGLNLQKLCLWNTDNISGMTTIRDCIDVGVGYLEILYTTDIPVLFPKPCISNVSAKLTYENHMKDKWYTETYGYSYTTYVEQLIDMLIQQQEGSKVAHATDNHIVSGNESYAVRGRTAVASLPPHMNLGGRQA